MRDYVLFSAILCLLSSLVVLTAGHWLSLFLLVFFLIRLCKTGKRTLIIGTLFFVLLTSFVTGIHQWSNQTKLLAEEQTFLMEVDADELKIDGNQIQFYGVIKATGHHPKISEKVITFYTLSSLKEKEDWQAQAANLKIKLTGKLTVPEKNRNQFQFNYQQFLYRKRIHWILKAETIQVIEQPVSFKEKLNFNYIRSTLLNYVDKTMSVKTAQYMKTLLFAEMASLDQATMQSFKNIGIVHLLSISGLHIQFLLTGLIYSFWRIGITKETTFYYMLVILPVYGSLTNWGTSVYRAVVMSLILLVSSHFKWKMSNLDAWSWTMLSALLIDPYQLYSVGFQLSYVLSLTLLILSQTFLSRSRPALVNNLLISFILMLVSIPILSFHFFEFSWIGVFANLLFVPIFAWLLLPVLIGLFFLSFFLQGSLIFSGIVKSLDGILGMLEGTVHWLSNRPFAMIVTGRVPLFLTSLFILSLLYFLMTLENKKRKRRYSIGLLFVVLITFVAYQRYSPFGEVILIDVGQGDAVLIKEPFGRGNYLIDTGGMLAFEKEDWEEKEKPTSVASRTLIPVLKAHGLSSLDQVFITHGDEDHMGALEELSETIQIKELLFPAGTTNKAAFLQTVLKLKSTGTFIQEVLASTKKRSSVNQSLSVLWPFVPGQGENNDSMVLYGKIGSFYWLFTGDLEEEGEKKIVQHYPELKVDVLKVGHHGSRTSSTKPFLDLINPQKALISCGLKNRYRHPDPDVLLQLQQTNAHIYRTDLDGAVHYRYIKIGEHIYREKFYAILK